MLMRAASLRSGLTLAAAASYAERVFPFQYCPLAILQDLLDLTDHLGRGETRGKHLLDCSASVHRRIGHLVIGSVFRVEARQRFCIGAVECFYPGGNELTWLHAL